jgi:predicted esterase
MRKRLQTVCWSFLYNAHARYAPQMLSAGATSTPIFWGHGTADAVVPYKFGTLSVQFLQESLGFKNVQFNSYQGVGHSADQQEIADLGAWLKRVIPA